MKKLVLLFSFIICALPSTMLQAMNRRPMDVGLPKYPPAPDPHSMKHLGEYPQWVRLFQNGRHIVEVQLNEPYFTSLGALAETLQAKFPHVDEAILLYPMGIQIDGTHLLAPRPLPFYKKK